MLNSQVAHGDDHDAIYRHTQNWLAGFAQLVEAVYLDEQRTALFLISTNGPEITRLLATVRADLGDTLCRLTVKLNRNPAVTTTSAAVLDVGNLPNFTMGPTIAFYGQIVMTSIQEALLTEMP